MTKCSNRKYTSSNRRIIAIVSVQIIGVRHYFIYWYQIGTMMEKIADTDTQMLCIDSKMMFTNTESYILLQLLLYQYTVSYCRNTTVYKLNWSI